MRHLCILFLFILLIQTLSPWQVSANTDRFYGIKDNLSNSHVNSIYQDKSGFIWVCTDNGLNLFDGTEFKTYYHINNDTTSLKANSVLSILNDSKDNIWVGTTGGLQLLNKESDRFTNIHFSYPYISDFSYFSCIIEDSKGNIWISTSNSGAICLKAESYQQIYYLQANSNICSNKINTLFEDRFGNIWIGSQDNGISVLNTENHTLINYSHDPKDLTSLSSNKIFSISADLNGNILIGTIDGGIDLFDYTTKKLTRNYIPSAERIFTMKSGSLNNLWIGTDGNGLKSYDYQTKSIITVESDIQNIDMRKAKIHGVLEDRQGHLWVALYQKGILRISLRKKIFSNYGFNPFYTDLNIGTECILSVMEDHAKNIWIGTDGDGIYLLNGDRRVEKHYRYSRLPADVVLSIFEDSQKRIWVGTYLHGLFLYDKIDDRFQNIQLSMDGKEIKDIYTINEDKTGTLWIGTNENGVCLYNHEKKKIDNLSYNITHKQDHLPSNSIHTIVFDQNDGIWIGTSNAGVCRFQQTTKSFTYYNIENRKLNNNNIYAISQDHLGNIWVGTQHGLNYLDLKNNQTTLYTEANGLANASIAGIEIDKNNQLWISTSLGLSHFNPTTRQFSNYTSSDGLKNDEFRRGAHFQSSSGELFFGGIEGLSIFYPFTPKASYPLINLVFKNIFLYDSKADFDKKNNIIEKNIVADKTIQIDYNIRSFSIGFIALEYDTPEKVIYQVKMENFDTDWKTLPKGTRLASYTNLNHGDYIFKVRAFLPGTPSIERMLPITIHPPFWLSWWAHCIYIILIGCLLWFIYYIVQKRISLKEEAIRKENENLIMQSKLQFFTDISHEIRTPLTLILTPIEKLITETPEGKIKNTYKLIYRNGERILHLINQIMEMRKLDRGQIRLSACETELAPFFTDIASSFDDIAKEKNIAYTLTISSTPTKAWIDKEKIDKVLFNVLSNAFKYTPPNGKITLTIEPEGDFLLIQVADSGEGIPSQLREQIFNRFYQIPSVQNRNKVGTGIGLHLARSLMELHHGKISAKESAQGGALFVIELPLHEDYYKQDEKISQDPHESLATLVQHSALKVSDEPITDKPTSTCKSRYKLLIVEDDPAILSYLNSILCDNYKIIEATDGRQGLELAIQEMPDCIVSDVMMPQMNGIELCKKIKDNTKTCHIPIILLTAKTTIEQRVEGLEVGADSYIPKPFNIHHLRTRINKLIELRRTIKEKFEGKYEIPKEEIKIKSVDEKFMEQFEKIIKDQISNPDLTVDMISKQIGMSRSQLQRRLKQLTDQNPSDYLRIARLRFGATLLISKNLSISEVAYETGFSSLSHFSNSFREYYGMSPSRYIEINKNAS